MECKGIEVLSARAIEVRTLLVNHFTEDSNGDKRKNVNVLKNRMEMLCNLCYNEDARCNYIKQDEMFQSFLVKLCVLS